MRRAAILVAGLLSSAGTTELRAGLPIPPAEAGAAGDYAATPLQETVAGPASTGTTPGSGLEVAFNAAIVSDYRFRGVSYSDRKPAIQGGLDLSLPSGWYVGTWLSNLANYGGAHGEVDLYGGHSGTVAGLDYTATFYAYFYPDGTDTDYVEVQSTIGRSFGPVTTTLTLAYTPKQWNSDVDNLYTGLSADIAMGKLPLTASFSVGRENGNYDEKWDWSAGLTWRLDVLEITAAYVDSNYKGALEAGRNGRAGLLLSAKASF